MKNNIILLIANFALTLIIGGYLLYQSGATKNTSPTNNTNTEPITVTLDTQELTPQLQAFNKNLNNLSSTILRLNTTLIQYDILKEDMNHLAAVDRTIGLRVQATSNAKNKTKDEKNKKQADKVLLQLSKRSQQVKAQQNAHRQTILKLIKGLQRQLLQASLPEGTQLPPKKAQPRSSAQPQATPNPTPKTSHEPAPTSAPQDTPTKKADATKGK